MWLTDPANPAGRWALSASELGGRIYAVGGAVFNQPPYPTLPLVLEYTPPRIAQDVRLHANPMTSAGIRFVRVEWPSHAESIDLLQTQNQLQPEGWTDVELFYGTGETLSRDSSATVPAGFYRLRRELR
jgi:hypothetical protein